MEATIGYLILSLVLTIGASLNYRRSVLVNKEAVRLQKEANEAYANAHQHYKEAVQARIEAQQAKNEAVNALKGVQQYWDSHRPN